MAVFFQPVGFGTTSVHAENTVGLVTIMHAGGNYLRARGEYSPSRSRTQLITELPPHARRILGAHRHHHRARGNYLRMRGEYPMPDYSQLPVKELPPHARRILTVEGFAELFHGTTSACAENTLEVADYVDDWRNYLRVRGEYSLRIPGSSPCTELPPRARRIRSWITDPDDPEGTTSACAENTRR